jgi:hypothetical protein
VGIKGWPFPAGRVCPKGGHADPELGGVVKNATRKAIFVAISLQKGYIRDCCEFPTKAFSLLIPCKNSGNSGTDDRRRCRDGPATGAKALLFLIFAPCPGVAIRAFTARKLR